jgi:hypothetical protein
VTGSERTCEYGIDRKCFLNVDEDERQNREVEAVEHPAEKGRGKGAPLIARQFSESIGRGWLVVRGRHRDESFIINHRPPTTDHQPPTS